MCMSHIGLLMARPTAIASSADNWICRLCKLAEAIAAIWSLFIQYILRATVNRMKRKVKAINQWSILWARVYAAVEAVLAEAVDLDVSCIFCWLVVLCIRFVYCSSALGSGLIGRFRKYRRRQQGNSLASPERDGYRNRHPANRFCLRDC